MSVAIVTGGSRGLGEAVADGLIRAGWSEVVDAARQLGGLDLLVNNAGTLGTSPLPSLADYPLGDLRVAFEVNVVAPLGLIQEALPVLLDAERPRLINITSDAGVEAYEGWGGYGAGQAALPGEDISDRPEPQTVVPAFLDLVSSDRPSGRYRATELLVAGTLT